MTSGSFSRPDIQSNNINQGISVKEIFLIKVIGFMYVFKCALRQTKCKVISHIAEYL